MHLLVAVGTQNGALLDLGQDRGPLPRHVTPASNVKAFLAWINVMELQTNDLLLGAQRASVQGFNRIDLGVELRLAFPLPRLDNQEMLRLIISIVLLRASAIAFSAIRLQAVSRARLPVVLLDWFCPATMAADFGIHPSSPPRIM
jgi:hypothetical protein